MYDPYPEWCFYIYLFVYLFIYIEVQLIYNVVLVSGVQQSQLYKYIFFFRFFSIIGYYKILKIAPCAIQ